MDRPGPSRPMHCILSPSMGWYFYPVAGRPFQPLPIRHRLHERSGLRDDGRIRQEGRWHTYPFATLPQCRCLSQKRTPVLPRVPTASGKPDDYPEYYSRHKPWEIGGEYPNLRSLKLRTSAGRENWPEHLFRQLTQLEIEVPLLQGRDPPYHHGLLSVATRLRSLTLIVDYGLPQPVIHKSLQTLILVYRIAWMVESTNTIGEIVCPELRRLEIRARFWELLSSIHLRYTQKLFDLCLVCGQDVKYGEEEALLLNKKWSGRIVELLRSIGTVKHLELEFSIEVVSRVVERIEADPTLCPDLESLRTESHHPVSNARASRRERSLLLKLEARISKRYQQSRRE